MRKITYFKTMLLAIMLVFGSASLTGQIVISQVYGGGGNSGATYKNDFIELYNRGTIPVSLDGWSVQYASATGTSWTSSTILTSVTLNPGQYYLIQEASGGTQGSTLPAADATGSINLSGTAGKVALCNISTSLPNGQYATGTGTNIIDFVGFGTTANGYEGSGATAAPSNTTDAIRKNGGCTDTNNNSSDFTIGTPTPRNRSTYQVVCSSPSTQTSNISFSNVSSTGMTVSWINGDGTNREVFMKEGTGTITNPTNSTLYGASLDWNTKGSQLGASGYYCVFNGTGNSVTVSNLLSNTTYTFQVFEYFGSGFSSNYLTSPATNNPNTQATSTGSLSPQTITFNALSALTYGATSFTVSATGGGSDNPVIFSSSDPTIATCTGTNGATITTLKAGSCNIYADQAGNASYNPATQVGQTLTVNAKALTIPDASVTSKTYNGTNSAEITGTLTGIINSDDVTLNGTGTFADVNVADGIAVTSTSTLGGAKAANYILTQPTGLIGSITKANQTITLAATATKYTGDADYSPAFSSTSSVNPISYTSSNTEVVTVVSGKIHIVGFGTATITASQSGNINYNPALDVTQDLTIANPPAVVSLRPTYIDLASTTSESAVLMTLTGYSSDDVRFRLYNGSNQYNPWDKTTNAYITSSSYSDGPQVIGSPSSTSTFWILFQRGNNISTDASYRDRLGTGYSTNYQTVALPAATSITSPFTLTGSFGASRGYDNSAKHVVLAFSGATLISATSTAITTGAFSVVCPNGTTINKIEIRDANNTLIVSINGNWTATTALGTLTYKYVSNGSGNWSTATNWIDNAVPLNGEAVILNNNITIDQDVNISTLTVNPGAKLTLNENKVLTANTLNINSDINGTGTIVGNVTGAAIVNQYLSDYRTWYMSSPVANAQPTGMNWIKSYNEADNSWPALFDARPESKVDYGINSFVTGKGYLVVPVSGNSIQFSGTLNNGNQNITLTRSAENGLKLGFNLIGNPYPSYLDWSKVHAANSSKMPTSTMWYRTKDGSKYKFWTVNGDGVASPNGASQYIPPMQAFWVRTNANNSQLNLTNDMRSHAPATDYLLKAPATRNTEKSLLRLQVSNDINTDETVIYFSEKASNGFDAYDSPKMSNDDVAIPEIFTRAGSEQLVINSMNSIPLNQEIALGFVAGNASSFSMKAIELSNLPSEVKVILKDNVTNAETDLTDGTTAYQFAPIATTTDRFSVIFRTASITTGFENSGNDGILVYSNAMTQLTISYKAAINIPSIVSVFNSVGQRLVSQTLTSNITVIDRTFIPGVYIVKVNNVTKRVVIK